MYVWSIQDPYTFDCLKLSWLKRTKKLEIQIIHIDYKTKLWWIWSTKATLIDQEWFLLKMKTIFKNETDTGGEINEEHYGVGTSW